MAGASPSADTPMALVPWCGAPPAAPAGHLWAQYGVDAAGTTYYALPADPDSWPAPEPGHVWREITRHRMPVLIQVKKWGA